MNRFRNRVTGLLIGLWVVASAHFVVPTFAKPQGFNYVVTRLDDPAPNGCVAGDCSLREAIIAANSTPGQESIGMGVTGTIELTRAGADEDDAATGDLDITDGIEIFGPVSGNPTALVVDANGLDRVFDFIGASRYFPVDGETSISIYDMTITGGSVVVASGNTAGGGVRSRFTGAATLSGVIIHNNYGGGTLSSGGGVAHENGVLVITNSAIVNNSADIGAGVSLVDGTLYLHNTTVSGNIPTQQVGGVLNLATTASFTSTLWLESVTIAYNGLGVPGDSTGGLATTAFGGTAQTFVKNSIIAKNSGVQCSAGGGGSATITSQGYNLSSHAGCFFTQPTDLQSSDPLLGALLLDTSGPRATYVHLLSNGSPALDSGDSLFDEDTRMVTRPQDLPQIPNIVDGDDRGAVEMVTEPPTAVILTTFSMPRDDGVLRGAAMMMLVAVMGMIIARQRD